MKTVIKNLVASARHLGYLPPHGKSLSATTVAGDTVTIDGDLETILASNGSKGRRDLASLLSEETAGRIKVTQTEDVTAAPTVTSVSPLTGVQAGGTAVTITGTGFSFGAQVLFDASAATSEVVVSDTSITCLTPAHAAGAVTVTVTNTDTQLGTKATAFTYV
jgi:hypothetical protein